ncbi:SMI1/KNR4 family protein [Flavobacterium ginsengiterrae]|uniref:Knr4/Smi1-like domain-containing protein n=1 Tax=Flavobacterium ginsengiterrae TaxID=871695 RepID=A0ABP7GN61_9FLAO
MDAQIANQIERIKKKLILAKESDLDFKVFGASSHKYEIGPTVTTDEVLKFEKEYDLDLPECYKAFLLHIGNGGISYENSAAGPCYGIFPFGENVDDLMYQITKEYLKQDCIIYPNMSDEFWYELTKHIEENEDIEEGELYEELSILFSGILPISSQGCSYYYGLVLHGFFKGRIVNIDINGQKPYFVYEQNFLDWYERWLGGIINENIKYENPDLFSYTLSGTAEHILDIYFSTDDIETKIECLKGLFGKKNIDIKTLDALANEYNLSSGEIKKSIISILTKNDYNYAFDYLVDYSKENLLDVLESVFWYAEDKSNDWLEVIEENASKINDGESFSYFTYLLQEMNIDYASIIIPFTSHPDKNIRVSAYYSLGLLKNKKDYLETFISALHDKENCVIHTSLKALHGVNDKRLLKHYKKIAEQFPVEQDYILVNLNYRLKEFGLTNETIKHIDPDNY